MATLKDMQKDIARQKRNVQKAIRFLNSRALYNMLADEAIKIIRRRVKSGFGVNKVDGKVERQKLKRLSDAYINQRKGLVQFTTNDGRLVSFKIKPPKLGEFGAPSRSNLTFKGYMLNAFAKKINSKGFEIYIAATSRPDTTLTNADVARLVSDDRPFMALTDGEQRILDRKVSLAIEKILLSR